MKGVKKMAKSLAIPTIYGVALILCFAIWGFMGAVFDPDLDIWGQYEVEASETIEAGIIPIDPVDVWSNIPMLWQDVDCSLYGVPDGAEGVILEVVATIPYQQNHYAIREKGSTDYIVGRLGNYCHAIIAVGVDEDCKFQALTDNVNTDIWIVGYVPDGAGTFLTNAQDVSLRTLHEWAEEDISTYTGSETAKVAFLWVRSPTSGFRAYDLREKGSTDDRHKVVISNHALRGAMVGLNDERFEGWINDPGMKFYLVGWLNVGYAETFPNAIKYSTDTEGQWVDTLLEELPDWATGAFLVFHNPSAPDEYLGGFRPDGSTFNNFYCIRHIQHFWCAVMDRTLEQKIDLYQEDGTSLNLWLWGYTGGEEEPPFEPYYKQVRFSEEEWEALLDLPDGEYCESIEVSWDGQEWVFDCLINEEATQ